jgi:hypothetical protein
LLLLPNSSKRKKVKDKARFLFDGNKKEHACSVIITKNEPKKVTDVKRERNLETAARQALCEDFDNKQLLSSLSMLSAPLPLHLSSRDRKTHACKHQESPARHICSRS